MKLDKILQIAGIDKELINEGSFYSELPKRYIYSYFCERKIFKKDAKYFTNKIYEKFVG